MDGNNNIFVTGFAHEEDTDDFVTLWYDTDGDELWRGQFNSVYNRKDRAAVLQLDGDDAFYVTGRTVKVDSIGSLSNENTTVRYKRSCDYIIPPDDEMQSSSIVFVKNNGQLLKTNGDLAGDVIYYTNSYSPMLNFQQDKINFVLAQENGVDDDYFRVDMNLGNSGRGRNLFALEQRLDYFNYYLGHIQQGREHVPLYERLIYCEAFEGVDLEVSTNTSSIKYYFIIKPGEDPSAILLSFSGQTGLSIVSNELIIGTSLGNIVLPQGEAYQVDLSGNVSSLAWAPSYSISGSDVSFTIGSYNTAYYLVIEISGNACMANGEEDDNNDWSTFYGGGSFDKDFADIKNDGGNNSFVTGYTLDTDFPTANGYQSALAGDRDAFLIKFDDNAKRKFATYFGGSNLDEGRGVETDNQGKSYMVGRTWSTASTFPLHSNGVAYHDPVNTCPSSPCYDAFIVGFKSDGTRDFATFYGGMETSMANAIKRNSVGEFYVAGKGDAVLPPISAPFEQSGGESFIARFSPSFAPIWSSSYKAYAILDLAIDNADNVFITGFAHNDGIEIIGPVTNSLKQSFGGGSNDGFIAKITDSPIDIVWSSYYGGDEGEQFEGIAVDNGGNVYVVGWTYGGSSTPTYDPMITGALFNSSSTDTGFDAFFAKFDNDGVPLWGTFFGGDDFDKGWDVEVDNENNVYFVGTSDEFTDSPKDYLNYYYQDSNAGSQDAFIVCLNSQLQPKWITNFGGSGAEAASACSISPNNILYLTGLANVGAFVWPNADFPLEDFDGSGQNDSYFQCDFPNSDQGFPAGFVSRFHLEDANPTTQMPFSTNGNYILYPNPASAFVLVATNNFNGGYAELQIIDALGNCRLKRKIFSQGERQEAINVSFLNDGVYFLKIVSQKNQATNCQKLIIQR